VPNWQLQGGGKRIPHASQSADIRSFVSLHLMDLISDYGQHQARLALI